MNKIKVGRFLKEQRNAVGLTMNALISKLEESNLGVTIKTVSDWEAGKMVPELEKLVFLADLYNVTVDEILGGERRLKEDDFLEKYPALRDGFGSLLGTDNDRWQKEKFQCTIRMKKTFKELIFKAFDNSLSANEERELAFIFKNECSINSNFEEDFGEKGKDLVDDFFWVIRCLRGSEAVKTKEEFYWELSKYFNIKRNGELGAVYFSDVADDNLSHNERLRSLVDLLDPLEKDALVVGFQDFNPIFYHANTNSHLLEDYEKRTGKPFDEEGMFKKTLKYLLQHGCMLNPFFFGYYEVQKRHVNLIDKLEELYKLCERPLEMYVSGGEEMHGFYKRYLLENNRHNRFLLKYHEFLPIFRPGEQELMSPENLESLITDDPNDEKIFSWIKEHRYPNDAREERYIRADETFNLRWFDEKKDEFFAKEKRIESGLKEIKELEEKLAKGEITCEERKMVKFGPEGIHGVPAWVKRLSRQISLSDFESYRNKEASEALLAEIDKLSVKQIREKYFPRETYEREVKDDD